MSRVAPSGATSAAARRSDVLYDAARRLPEIPRIRIGLGGLDGRDADQQLDVVGDEQIAVGKRLVPLEIELAPIDRALELEANALVAPRVLAVLGDLPGELDRLGDALDRNLAGERDLAVGAGVGAGRAEGDLRMLGDVEEFGALQVPVAVLLAAVDRGDVDPARQHGGVARSVDGALEAAERPSDGGDTHVLDGEADVRMSRIDVVDPGRDA